MLHRETQETKEPHVVILGAGFAGIAAAHVLGGTEVRVSVIDQNNYHLFQPLLYQVATAGLSGAEITEPIRYVLRRHANISVILADVLGIDAARSEVILRDEPNGEERVAWDYLIVAVGACTSWFGRASWEERAPGLKSLADAHRIRDQVLLSYERAELCSDPVERERLLTFVVIGGGPTGVELAGALAEIAHRTMARNFRRFDPSDAKVVLLEAGTRLLSSYDERLSDRARRDLEKLGVEVWLSTPVDEMDETGIRAGGVRLDAETVLWAAGVRAQDLVGKLEGERLADGRVKVEPDLRLPGYERIWLAGDVAAARLNPEREITHAGDAVPGVAPAAQQMGGHVAKEVLRHVRGGAAAPFRYRDKGSMATIGKSRAVAEVGGMRFSGLFAWLLWVFVHLMALVGFRNRAQVFLDWLMAYFSRRRGARVILRR